MDLVLVDLIVIQVSDTVARVIGMARHVTPIMEEIGRIGQADLVRVAGIVVQIFKAVILDMEDRMAGRDTIGTRIDANPITATVDRV